MAVKLLRSKVPTDVAFVNLHDGAIAECVKARGEYWMGKIVIRIGNDLYVLGDHPSNGIKNFHKADHAMRFRPLEKDEQIVIC